ncbi:MAG: purine-nucleoside phosphorylase [Acidobacteriaceae bacterium]
MQTEIFGQIETAAAFLREQLAAAHLSTPTVGLVLGSGLGAFAGSVQNALAIPYHQVPHFPQSTVEGHAGRLVFGTVEGAPVAVLQGRVHAYEGHAPHQVVFPVRVLARLGVRQLVLTNAAGSLRKDLPPGTLVAIADHINFSGLNPVAGPNDPRLGPRFFDMTAAYSPRLRQMAQAIAQQQGWQLPEGVYISVLGPSYETPAEIRAFRALGADLVGMSTVQETIAARHMGVEVLGISCVTNFAAGASGRPLDHAEVMETGKGVEAQLTRLFLALMPALAASTAKAV